MRLPPSTSGAPHSAPSLDSTRGRTSVSPSPSQTAQLLAVRATSPASTGRIATILVLGRVVAPTATTALPVNIARTQAAAQMALRWISVARLLPSARSRRLLRLPPRLARRRPYRSIRSRARAPVTAPPQAPVAALAPASALPLPIRLLPRLLLPYRLRPPQAHQARWPTLLYRFQVPRQRPTLLPQLHPRICRHILQSMQHRALT